MIAGVKGTICQISPGEVWVDTGCGFIVHVFYPVSSYSTLKNEKEILLHTVFRHKEEESYLYGFISLKEKTFFEKMISISGVGGKTALSFISAFSIPELTDAINSGDVSKLISIPGIGKKTAQRIILELTGKLDFEEDKMDDKMVKMKEDLVSGMVNLGFLSRSVTGTVEKMVKENPEETSFEVLFKRILKQIRKI
ncbi:MAG: Holliday junction branch migration protein RuvA [Candidatus Aminicenantes bacterium]|nr:Holliday junction branch migration protein RuvA [Candidatus Aminicenantes bacterium]